jgi:hypothetical protein
LQAANQQQDTATDATACTSACTSQPELEQIAAELRGRLTAEDCRRLAAILTTYAGQ